MTYPATATITLGPNEMQATAEMQPTDAVRCRAESGPVDFILVTSSNKRHFLGRLFGSGHSYDTSKIKEPFRIVAVNHSSSTCDVSVHGVRRQPKQWPQWQTVQRRIGVVVATRDRANYLPCALQQLLDQSLKPQKILVVDDGSTDDTKAVVDKYPEVDYVYVDLGKGETGSFAKRVGFEKLINHGGRLDYVASMDDDDYIPLDYYERLVEAMESDCRVGVAYPSLQQFGNRNVLTEADFDDDSFARSNYVPATSLIRVDALQQAGGWQPPTAMTAHDDWSNWSRIRSLGWHFKRGATTYFYRRHRESCTFRHRGGKDAAKKWGRCVDWSDKITIATPFAGRWDRVDGYINWLKRLRFPLDQLRLLALDNSCEPEFATYLRFRLAEIPFGSLTIMQHPWKPRDNQSTREAADDLRHGKSYDLNHHVGGLWNRIAQSIQTPMVLCVEDDIIPPDDVVELMLNRFNREIDAVSGVYDARHGESSVKETPHGKSVGFGCVMVRRQWLQAGPMRSIGSGPDGAHWFDHNFWADFHRRGGRLRIEKTIRCDHKI